MTLLPFDLLDDSGPASQRLTHALRRAVVDGRLRPGQRLPSTRQLAQDLGVSRWMVTEAYEQLHAEGFLSSRVGAGTFVRDLPHSSGTRAERSAPSSTTATNRLNLRPNVPDLRGFPIRAWRTASSRVLTDLRHHELHYPDPTGHLRLRRAVADYLLRVRGIAADPSDVCITSGTSHGLILLCRALGVLGYQRLAVEDPGWPRVRAAARASNIETVPVRVDEGGLRVGQLIETSARTVYVTPAHQFPTGAVLSGDRRQQLLRWLRDDRLVLEDDYDAEFRFDRRPAAALAAAGGHRIVYLGSASKTLVPAVRIGWMVLHGHIGEAVREELTAISSGPSTLDQLTLAEMITSGAYERHIRRMRRLYQAKRAELAGALAHAVPQGRIVGSDAGAYCLLQVEGADDVDVARRLANHNIDVVALRDCTHGRSVASGILIGYGNLPSQHVSRVAASIAAALDDQAASR